MNLSIVLVLVVVIDSRPFGFDYEHEDDDEDEGRGSWRALFRFLRMHWDHEPSTERSADSLVRESWKFGSRGHGCPRSVQGSWKAPWSVTTPCDHKLCRADRRAGVVEYGGTPPLFHRPRAPDRSDPPRVGISAMHCAKGKAPRRRRSPQPGWSLKCGVHIDTGSRVGYSLILVGSRTEVANFVGGPELCQKSR